MKCSECNAYIDQWTERILATENSGEIFSEIDQLVLDHVSQCHGCALHLAAARMVTGTSQQERKSNLPKGLQDRIVQSVLSEIRKEEMDTHIKKQSRWQKHLLVAAVLMAILIPFFGERNQDFIPIQEGATELAQVKLQLDAPYAEVVVVVGDWNNWDPQSSQLAKINQGGVWSIEMELERGKEYRYQFIIDGEQWIPDPNAYLQVDDGFGGKNSVLEM